jgi:2-polyprenyl-3-methyl-5-hydroxy-6-metoxy-1,4-benzoquinol methylase
MDPEYAAKYGELYKGHWWWRAREIIILEVIRELLPASGWHHILDVGCGDGLFFGQLLTLGDVEGVEPDASIVRNDGPYRSRIHTVPLEPDFLPQSRYSLILMLDILEHLSDPTAALRHAAQLLTPNGIIICTVPAFNVLWTSHDTLNRHYARHTKRSVRALMQVASLEIVRESYLYQWVFAAKLIRRVFEHLVKARPSVPHIPCQWINTLFIHMTLAEYRLLSPLPVPFGSSLLVAARRRKV